MIRLKHSTIYTLIFCFSYAILLASLNSEIFRDRNSYSGYYASISDFMLSKAYHVSLLKLFTEEPLFLILNILLTKILSISNNALPQIYVFFISFVFSFATIKNSRNFTFAIICILMLFSVSVSWHAQLVVLRQSIATSILLIFIIKKSSLNKLLFILFLCALIHNSFFIILAFFILIKIFCENHSLMRIVFISLLFSFISCIGFYIIGKYLSIRQIDYVSMEINSSGAGFILWTSCLLIILIKNKGIKSVSLIDTISIFGLIFYSFNYYFLPIGGRFLVTFIPFIFMSLTSNIYKKEHIPILLTFDVFFIGINLYKLNPNLINNSFNHGYQIINLLGL
ncbi:EpsG family protein [Proteus mirabilis]|uniref:EpsG family protein n=1 Tax=Proteus mirabilis TaxID=584 RepID=UPI0015844678|nr:EpsG family protein [Proteus mirabilis]MBG2816090.1 EpsG family protein [Proteus mirabilis]MDC9761024.1 EpsG family protein [Proteus mirabilis]MDF7216645.1 EpsG family protein [Proteus mirabilis]MDF7259267.1 EpsG family protein [Proteus mirabilis]MDF7295915.1 EpsG family protein [Proteus mirabilis]